MIDVQNVLGMATTQVIQLFNPDGSPAINTYQLADTLTAAVWAGFDQPAIFAPAVSWNGNDPSTGMVKLAIVPSDTSGLDPHGTYRFQVYVTPALTDLITCVAEGTLTVQPAPGAVPATPTPIPYCSFADLLRIAPWVDVLQNTTVDVEGFLYQRLSARQWMDATIGNCYRGTATGNFEAASMLAFAFGGGLGNRRSQGRSPAMITWLAEDRLLVLPDIVEACAHKAAALIGTSQMGQNNLMFAQGQWHMAMASRTLIGITAELDLADPRTGIGTVFVNLGATNTLFT